MSALNRKRVRDYFDEESDEDNPNISSSNSEGIHKTNASHDNKQSSSHDDIDPLDAYMQDVEQVIQNSVPNSKPSYQPQVLKYDEDEDYEEELHRNSDDDNDAVNSDVDYDSDGIPINSKSKKTVIAPLPVTNHSEVAYIRFRKNLYNIHPELRTRSSVEVANLLESLEISAENEDILCPLERFEHAGFEAKLLREIYKHGYQKPTPIQAQAIPIALSGRNLIGLAKTGSGKTLAYLWPTLVHVNAQPRLVQGDGPIAIILAPTRELVMQIYHEGKSFCNVYNQTICPIYGGAGKYEMSKALKLCPEIVVATPGRLIEFIKSKVTNLSRCSLIVLDEADRMFELGFELQVTSIVNNIRGDRQVLLFSATMRNRIESFIRNYIEHPTSGETELKDAYSSHLIPSDVIRIVVGRIGQANPDIHQIPVILSHSNGKLPWLKRNIDEFLANGKILIFANEKVTTEELNKELNEYFISRQLFVKLAFLHGDVDQSERMKIVNKFSQSKDQSVHDGHISVLIATDVASRGLDIRNINTVINYDVPKNIEIYVHRIGRTGRLGLEGVKPGVAYSLLSPLDSSFAVDLVRNLKVSGQAVPEEVLSLAKTDARWRDDFNGSNQKFSRNTAGGSKSMGLGSAGARKAMTSEMMADQTKAKAVTETLQSSMTFSKILGSGLGSYSSKNERNSSDVARSSDAKDVTEVISKSINQSQQSASSTLRGFVRSSQSYSSVHKEGNQPPSSSVVSSSNVIANEGIDASESKQTVRKRSRWDS